MSMILHVNVCYSLPLQSSLYGVEDVLDYIIRRNEDDEEEYARIHNVKILRDMALSRAYSYYGLTRKVNIPIELYKY